MRSPARKRLLFLATIAAAFIACTLNPQPIPPVDERATGEGPDAGSAFGNDAEDAASPAVPQDGSLSSDGGGSADGDGGDGGDAAADADDAG